MKRVKLFLSLLICSVCLWGCGGSSEPVANIVKATGEATCKLKPGTNFVKAEPKTNLMDGGVIKTSDGASVDVFFLKDKSNAKIGENTYFEIKNFSQKELKQMGGVVVYNISPQDKELTVETPHGMATVLGTVFRIDIAATFTTLIVEKGTVQLTSGEKKAVVKNGEMFSTYQNSDEEPVVVDPFELEKLFSGNNLKPTLNRR